MLQAASRLDPAVIYEGLEFSSLWTGSRMETQHTRVSGVSVNGTGSMIWCSSDPILCITQHEIDQIKLKFLEQQEEQFNIWMNLIRYIFRIWRGQVAICESKELTDDRQLALLNAKQALQWLNINLFPRLILTFLLLCFDLMVDFPVLISAPTNTKLLLASTLASLSLSSSASLVSPSQDSPFESRMITPWKNNKC